MVRPMRNCCTSKRPLILHHLVEDVLHDVGVDQVAFRFDHFLEWHQNFYCSGEEASVQAVTAAGRCFSRILRSEALSIGFEM